MFRKPHRRITSGSSLIETPSSPSGPIEGGDSTPQPAADPISVASSPPSPKKQKLSHPVSTPSRTTPSKTPGKPKQSLLTPYAVGSAKKSGSSFGSSKSTGKSGQKKNTSILSFFKPVTPTTDGKGSANGSAKSTGGGVVLKGAQSDELFVRHGGYDLEVSEPEDEDDEENTWAVERSLAGELELAKRDDELFSSPVGIRSGRPELPFAMEEEDVVESPDGEDMVIGKEVVDEIESTAPTDIPTKTPAAAEPVTPLRQAPKFNLKFNPASLNLDGSRSILFSKRGATPPSFKKLKQEKSKSSSSSSAEEAGFHDEDGVELGLVDEKPNKSIEGFMVEKEHTLEKKETATTKRTREQAFMQDSTESLGDSSIKKEGAEETLSPEVEAKLEDCILTSKPRKREGSAFEDDEFEDIEDFPDEEINFEELEGAYTFSPANRAEAGYEDFDGDFGSFEDHPKLDEIEDSTPREADNIKCPICLASIGALPEKDANDHVNHCLDGTPIPPPTPPAKKLPFGHTSPFTSPFFGRAPVVTPSPSSPKPSAFTKLMSTNSESQAWASAAKSEVDSRGKRAVDRTCPFYKILFNGSITVDAFRYGSVPGCKAYFLSHFHSDHYVGLSSKWSHGPIYCSRVTANLVRNKLGVDPKYVHELAWEEWTSFGVDGIRVRGLDANHCPGSMLFLFEETKKGGRRVLHCGDFRACPEHLRHPLLMPGKDGVKGQRLDVVYLDTTYLNPKYAFPAQGSVIEACSTMCVKLQKQAEGEGWSVAGKKGGVGSFMASTPESKKKGRLLVIVGTYSIGKERVCLGIAKALGSKIFAPPNKLKICHQLEDPVLNSLLTSDPHKAQVHMTPLMEIRPETLQEYLNTFKPHFNRIVGFRPSGWNYKPPNSRFTESPAVSTVLHGVGWRSEYSTKEMEPMRGSGRDVKCFGVPYSEHSSFRELSMFICGLNVGRVIPTVNIGSAKSRDGMKVWFEKWEAEKGKNGLFRVDEGDGRGGQW